MSTLNVDKITRAQIRAARALLDLTQPALAKTAGIGLSTVVDFEKARRVVSDEAINAMKIALEKLGVEFIDQNGGGPGVRLRRRVSRRHKSETNS